MPGDLVAQTDQGKEAAKTVASLLSAFYGQLIADKVDVTTARYLTQEYQKSLKEK